MCFDLTHASIETAARAAPTLQPADQYEQSHYTPGKHAEPGASQDAIIDCPVDRPAPA